MSEDAVVERLKEGEITDEDVALLTDDDVRQLVIYHATMFYHHPVGETPEQCDERRMKIRQTWRGWPRVLWDRFSTMVLLSHDRFWDRPARINNRFGIG